MIREPGSSYSFSVLFLCFLLLPLCFITACFYFSVSYLHYHSFSSCFFLRPNAIVHQTSDAASFRFFCDCSYIYERHNLIHSLTPATLRLVNSVHNQVRFFANGVSLSWQYVQRTCYTLIFAGHSARKYDTLFNIKQLSVFYKLYITSISAILTLRLILVQKQALIKQVYNDRVSKLYSRSRFTNCYWLK